MDETKTSERRRSYRIAKAMGVVNDPIAGRILYAGGMLQRARKGLPAEGHPIADIMTAEHGLVWVLESLRDATPPGWPSWMAWAHWRINGLLAAVDRWRTRALAAEARLRLLEKALKPGCVGGVIRQENGDTGIWIAPRDWVPRPAQELNGFCIGGPLDGLQRASPHNVTRFAHLISSPRSGPINELPGCDISVTWPTYRWRGDAWEFQPDHAAGRAPSKSR